MPVENVRLPVEIKDVSLDRLEKPSYQRDISPERLEMYLSAWFWPMCDPILVNVRESGRWVVVDGMGRLAVHKKLGEPHITARVVRGWDEDTERRYYTGQRAREKSMTMWDIHRALRDASAPVALAIENIIRDSGLELSKEKNSQDGKIIAIKAVYKIIYGGAPISRADGQPRRYKTPLREDRLRQILRVLRGAFDLSGRAYTSVVLGGMNSFVTATQRKPGTIFDEARLIEAMRLHGLDEIITESAAAGASSAYFRMAVYLARIYNNLSVGDRRPYRFGDSRRLWVPEDAERRMMAA
jgi:hypothetical protein